MGDDTQRGADEPGWFRQWLQGSDGSDGPDGSDGGTSAGVSRTDPSRSDPAHAGDATRRADRPDPDVPPGRDGRLPGAAAPTDDAYPGQRLGLPETGPGSVATLPRRAAQFALDAVLAGLVAALFTYPALPQNWSLLAWAVLVVVPLAAIGMTPAMAMLGIRTIRLDRPDAAGIGLLWALVRSASVFFVIPALIVDRDVRGIHDRASRTMVVRTR